MLELKNVKIQFDQDVVIKGGNFKANSRCLVGLVGESGTGKSSLLDILGLKAYHGQCDYYFNNVNLKDVKEDEINALKRKNIAYITQTPEFISTMNCIDNIKLECEIANHKITHDKIDEILSFVGLKTKKAVYPSKLSGGEKQRLAFAMALAKDSDVLLCDELTSHLDKDYAKKIIDLLYQIAHQFHKIVILTTHDKNVLTSCDVIYEIKDQTLNHLKDGNCLLEEKPLDIVPTKLSHQFYFNIIISRLKKRKLSYALTSLVCLIAVTVMVFSHTIISTATKITSILDFQDLENEVLVLNKTVPMSLNAYTDGNLPFSNDTVAKIKSLDFVEKAYPLFSFEITDSQDTYNEISFTNPQGQVESVNCAYGDFVGELLYPYYPEQKFEEKYDVTSSCAFIDPLFASQLGVTEIEDGTIMDLDVYVPVALEEGSALFQDGKEEAFWFSHYQKQHLTIPVKLLDHMLYHPSIPNQKIIIPYEVFNQLYEEAKASAKLEEGQIPYAPAYYQLFLKENCERDKVDDMLQCLDENLYVDDPYWRDVAIKGNDAYAHFDIFSHGMLVASALMMIVYGFYIDEENRKDYAFYQTRGITKKERRLVIIGEWLCLWLFVFPISVLLNVYLLTKENMFYAYLFTQIPLNLWHLCGYTCLVYGIVSLFAQIMPLVNAKRGDKQ